MRRARKADLTRRAVRADPRRRSRLGRGLRVVALVLAGLVLLMGLGIGIGYAARRAADRDGTLWKRGGYWPEFTNGFVHSVTWSPDGRRLAAIGRDGRLRIRDAATGERLLDIDTAFHDVVTDAVRLVAWSPDGRVLAVAINPEWPGPERKGWVVLRDADSGRELRVLDEHVDHVDALAFDATGARLAVSRSRYSDARPAPEGGEIEIWSREGERLETVRRQHALHLSASYAADGALVFGVLEWCAAENGLCDGKLVVHEIGGAETVIPVGREPRLKAVVPSPDGRRLAATFVASPRIAFYDRGGALVRVAGGEGPAGTRLYGGGAFTPEGRIFAYPAPVPAGGNEVLGWPGAVALWDVETGARTALLEVRFMAGGPMSVMALAVSPDGKLLAAGMGTAYLGQVAVWRMPSRGDRS